MNGVNSINLDGITVTSNIFYDQYFFDSYTVVSCSAKQRTVGLSSGKNDTCIEYHTWFSVPLPAHMVNLSYQKDWLDIQQVLLHFITF